MSEQKVDIEQMYETAYEKACTDTGLRPTYICPSLQSAKRIFSSEIDRELQEGKPVEEIIAAVSEQISKWLKYSGAELHKGDGLHSMPIGKRVDARWVRPKTQGNS